MGKREEIERGVWCVCCAQYIEFDEPATYWGIPLDRPRVCGLCKELACNKHVVATLEEGR